MTLLCANRCTSSCTLACCSTLVWLGKRWRTSRRSSMRSKSARRPLPKPRRALASSSTLRRCSASTSCRKLLSWKSACGSCSLAWFIRLMLLVCRLVLNVQKTESRSDRIMSKLFGVFSSGLDMIVGEKNEPAQDKKQQQGGAGTGPHALGAGSGAAGAGSASGVTTVHTAPYFIIRHPIGDVLSAAEVAAQLKAAGAPQQPQQPPQPAYGSQHTLADPANLHRSNSANDASGFGLNAVRQPSPLTPSAPQMGGRTVSPQMHAFQPQPSHQQLQPPLSHAPTAQQNPQDAMRRPAPIHTRKPSAADLNLAPPHAAAGQQAQAQAQGQADPARNMSPQPAPSPPAQRPSAPSAPKSGTPSTPTVCASSLRALISFGSFRRATQTLRVSRARASCPRSAAGSGSSSRSRRTCARTRRSASTRSSVAG